MTPTRTLVLLLAISIIGRFPAPTWAKPLSKKEVVEFMGVYHMKGRSTILAGGASRTIPIEFRLPVRLNGSGGDGVTPSPGGSFRPVAARFKSGSNWIRVQQILRGNGVDPESGEYYETVGLTSLTLIRRGPRKFTARANSRVAFGSIAVLISRANGRKIS